MRRPNMLRYNDWIEDCVRELEGLPSATQSDLTVAAWVKLHHIAEEITVSLKYDDPAQPSNLDDARLKLLLKGFMKQLEAWESSVEPRLLHGQSTYIQSTLILMNNVITGSFAIMYHTVKIFLHEILLYSDHSPGDFRPPHPSETLRIIRSDFHPALSSEGLAIMISSAQALLQVFINMKADQVRSLPVSTVVRVRYAAYILCKLFVSAQDLTSSIGRLVESESLNLEYFLRLTGAKLQAAAEPLGWNVPSLFLGLLKKFYSWYLQQTGHAVRPQMSVGEPAQSFDQPLSQSKGQQMDQINFAHTSQIAPTGQSLPFEGFHDPNCGDASADPNLYDDQQISFDLDWDLDAF